MCWDERTSWTTFVLGTVFNVFNIFYFRDPVITVISILWEWVLMMQFFEAKAWGSQPSGKGPCSVQNKNAAAGALVANVTQPIILALGLIAFTPVPVENKILAMTVTFAYICWLTYALNKSQPHECLKPSESCSHLDLVWWKNFPGGALPYMVTLVMVILLLLRPMDLAWFELTFILATLAVSSVFYSCGAGSMWCWFAAFAPLATGAYWYYTRGPPRAS
jgi:hypothetical protein